MYILMSEADLAGLSPTCRDELLERFASRSRSALPPLAPVRTVAFDDIHMTDVEDVTFKNMGLLMEGLPSTIREGLRLIGEQGPVIAVTVLIENDINPRRFQSGTTRRVRALTGDRRAYLLGWDDWSAAEEGKGRYAVTPITHQSLQRYFGHV